VIRSLNPGYFALVMATGIVSKAMALEGAATLSGFLLGLGIVACLRLPVSLPARRPGSG
jgi:hypothetical protein